MHHVTIRSMGRYAHAGALSRLKANGGPIRRSISYLYVAKSSHLSRTTAPTFRSPRSVTYNSKLLIEENLFSPARPFFDHRENTADERREGHTPSIHPSSALSNRPTPLAKFAANNMVRGEIERTEKGAAIYSRPFLAIYDFWALGTISTYAWRCKVTKNLVPFFQQNVGKELLDIGVGTGYYLRHANLAPDVGVTLVDLNQNSLDAAKARLGRDSTECYVHDITKPLPMTTRFDSMSMFYLLHCMPGPVDNKTAIFANLKNHLTPDGVVFGATILGQGVRHNLLGRTVMYVFNKKGIFDNRGDSEAAIVDALREHFEIVDARIVGTILIFRGQKPKL